MLLKSRLFFIGALLSMAVLPGCSVEGNNVDGETSSSPNKVIRFNDEDKTISSVLSSMFLNPRIETEIKNILITYSETSNNAWFAVISLNEGNADFTVAIFPKTTDESAISFRSQYAGPFESRILPEDCKTTVPSIEYLHEASGAINENVTVSHPTYLYGMDVDKSSVKSVFERRKIGFNNLKVSDWINNCVN